MKRSLLVVILMLVLSSAAFAVPINPQNSRPVAVGSGMLQASLDTMYGAGNVDAYFGQQQYGMWSADNASTGIRTQLMFEYAGLAGSNIFGIWTATDTAGPISTVDIMYGGAHPQGNASLSWDSFNNMTINGGTSSWINNGTFAGIDPNSFGFYLRRADGTIFYTIDALNSGNPQALAYMRQVTIGGNQVEYWALAFEDLDYSGSDKDYDDMIVRVKFIHAVPEPGTLLLLGSGLIGAAVIVRKRIRK